MASTIGAFYSQSSWIALGLVILPTATEQLVQKLFAARVFAIESIAFIAGTVTYLILSTALPLSFQVGAPLVYLACKIAQAYWFRQTPPEPPASPKLPETPEPEELPQSTTGEPEANEEVASSELPEKAMPEESPSPPLKPPAATAQSTLHLAEVVIIDGKAVLKKPTEQLPQECQEASEKETKLWEEFSKITAVYKKSELRTISISQELSNKVEKATIRFGETHLFKFDEKRVEALRKRSCMITEEAYFFWIEATKKNASFLTVNLIPLCLLDKLGDTKFSLIIQEKDQKFEFIFEKASLTRLKAVATKLKKCRKFLTIPLCCQLFSKTMSIDQLENNELASMQGAKCYLEPFLEVKVPTEGDALKAEPSGI